MDEIFSIKTDGMGHLILFVNDQECTDVLVEGESEREHIDAIQKLVDQLPMFL